MWFPYGIKTDIYFLLFTPGGLFCLGEVRQYTYTMKTI